MTTNLFTKRFSELVQQLDEVQKTRHSVNSPSTGSPIKQVDSDLFLNWQVKARNLLERACGQDSQHFKVFIDKLEHSWSGPYDKLLSLKAILLAAQEDYNGGYLNNLRNLVQAEVFDDELEQATELLNNGYKTPAAVVAGIVLEVKLKELCTKNEIPLGKLGKMNEDLYKAGVYSLLLQKRVTALAQIRNDAAHGNANSFQDSDVTSMIDDVRKFVTDFA
jgi:hypothetical protein